MSSVVRHYDALLARHYVWMSGRTLEENVVEQQATLVRLGVGGGRLGLAIDLGSGPGYQAIALARLGYRRVMAIDASGRMLDDLSAARGALPIDLVHADLRALATLARDHVPDLIVCMGDTITHLDNRREVSGLVATAYELLAPGGLLVLTFRDLSVELHGINRFVPVRADEDRIMTCVLEYQAGTVVVNDLIHVREGPSWTLNVSSYRKLRIAPCDLADELESVGFLVVRNEPAGNLHALVARKADT